MFAVVSDDLLAGCQLHLHGLIALQCVHIFLLCSSCALLLLTDGTGQVSGCEAFAMSHMQRQTLLACVKDGTPALRAEV